MNQEEKIKELLAEIKALKEETTKYKEQKAYGLVWENEKNKEKIVEDCKKKLPILERVKDKEIITDKTQPMNLMIEGDNYHALTCLNYTHRGKIDVIYIDPPYNTGAKDWKYNNDYVDSEDNFRHSKWINMMYNRLFITKNLLKDNGILICAIDENELCNLGCLFSEIFKKKYYEHHLITIKHNPRGVQGNNFSYVNEYAFFIFSKGKNLIQDIAIEENDISWRGLRDNGGESLRSDAKNCFYSIKINKKKEIIGIGDVCSDDFHPTINVCNNSDIIEIYPIDVQKIERKWRYARQSIEKVISLLKVKETNGIYDIQIGKDFKKVKTIWDDKKYDSNEWGAKLLKQILKKRIFDYPKSLNSILDALKITSQKDSIILDFFAGSGTAGHAVMELNKEDGGNRKFILCTNNENNNGNGQGGIAEAVCYPRIKKVIKGYKKNGDGEWVAGLGGNLHYFKADENSFISVETLKKIDDKKRLELTLKAGELIAIRENIFDEKEHSKYYQIFEDNHKQVAIYFTEELIKLNELMEKLDSKKEKIVYLFGWGKTLFTGDDLGYPDINVKDIPEPIIRIYQEINR